jgi:hypothetical protein
MEPSFLSKAAWITLQMGWHQIGQTVTYEPSIYTDAINELNPNLSRQYMQLSFEYSFA